MYQKKGPNSITKFFDLILAGEKIGQFIVNYNVIKYDDVETQDFFSVKKSINKKFLLNCTQRIIISNKNNPLLTSPSDDLNSYNDYPAFIDKSIIISDENKDDETDVQVLDYSPKTINTQVQQSGSNDTSNGTSLSNNRSTTVGSSISETHSFGTSVSLGTHASLLDAGVTSNITQNFDYSTNTTNENSITSGTDISNNKNQSLSETESMSIKDWGAFAYQKQNKFPVVGWIFGQEYPWNAITCRKRADDSTYDNNTRIKLVIPKNMQANLYDEALLPPSELSLFGVNFVSKSLYLITLKNSSESLAINHAIYLYTASHRLNNNQIEVYIDQQANNIFNADAVSINLPIMALDVLGLPNKDAIIGFIPNKFTVVPHPMRNGVVSAFKITSAANNLYIKDTTQYDMNANGAGFSASETRLISCFSEQCISLEFTIYFKIVDTGNLYNLYLKHWKMKGSKGIKLTFTINENFDNQIVKYVDEEEAEGAEKNLLSIALRDLSYASVDYHDYLQFGLNSIKVSIEPIDQIFSQNCCYEIRAISIEST